MIFKYQKKKKTLILSKLSAFKADIDLINILFITYSGQNKTGRIATNSAGRRSIRSERLDEERKAGRDERTRDRGVPVQSRANRAAKTPRTARQIARARNRLGKYRTRERRVCLKIKTFTNKKKKKLMFCLFCLIN